ncbi:hypothetical protein J6590_062868 [Homalodisca vitripennis]|nr:hypothetical protein J6590_062868 [Homalodisca vitripennis]
MWDLIHPCDRRSGKIDHAHHYNNPYRALEETLMLDAALLAVLSMVDQSQTLVVVTSDHSHVMSLGGISTPRGNPILGKCNNPMETDLVILVAKGEALHDQSSVQEIDDLSKQKRHVKSGEVLRHAGSTNFV